MRFLVDECTGPAVARWLRQQNHEVFSVYEEARGMGDDAVLQKAHDENWILITNDRHFGELESVGCMLGGSSDLQGGVVCPSSQVGG